MVVSTDGPRQVAARAVSKVLHVPRPIDFTYSNDVADHDVCVQQQQQHLRDPPDAYFVCAVVPNATLCRGQVVKLMSICRASTTVAVDFTHRQAVVTEAVK